MRHCRPFERSRQDEQARKSVGDGQVADQVEVLEDEAGIRVDRRHGRGDEPRAPGPGKRLSAAESLCHPVDTAKRRTLVNVRVVAVAFFVSVLVATESSSAAPTVLTGKMSLYNYLLPGRWSCDGGGGTYSAEYVLAPGNMLHGHLSSAQGSEDAYFGYSDAARRFWTVGADPNGATESQTSVDGVTYTGKVNDGKMTSNAKERHCYGEQQAMDRARAWHGGGQPYDLIVTCERTY